MRRSRFCLEIAMNTYQNTHATRVIFSILKAFFVVAAIGIGMEITAIFRHEPSRLMQHDYLLTYIAAYVVLSVILFLKQENIEISLDESNINLNIDDEKQSISVDELEKIVITGLIVKNLKLVKHDGATKVFRLGTFSHRMIKQLEIALNQQYPKVFNAGR